jgi:hypothetical protein
MSKVDVKIDITMFLREVESLRFVMFKDKAQGLSQKKHSIICLFELTEIS